MNTTPDELTLARWLDDELLGVEREKVDSWAAENPEQLEAREKLRRYKRTLREILPAGEEPPYADFFLTRVRQGIKNLEAHQPDKSKKYIATAIASLCRNWLMPIAAFAGVMLAFFVGRQTANPITVAANQQSAPVLYTPEDGVDATWVPVEQANASVIILQGVPSISDTTDLSAIMYVPKEREIDRTATRHEDNTKAKKQNQ